MPFGPYFNRNAERQRAAFPLPPQLRSLSWAYGGGRYLCWHVAVLLAVAILPFQRLAGRLPVRIGNSCPGIIVALGLFCQRIWLIRILFYGGRINSFDGEGKHCRNILIKEKIVKKKLVQMKGRFKKNLVVFLGVMVVFCVAGAVQAAGEPDFSRFPEVAGSNGAILRDNNTKLEWQRCPYGQSWTVSGCSGTPWKGKWDDAVRITDSGGFRLPTIDELKTLYPYDQSIFPGGGFFWSSSPYASATGYAWFLYFDGGYVGSDGKDDGGQARLVRGGQ